MILIDFDVRLRILLSYFWVMDYLNTDGLNHQLFVLFLILRVGQWLGSAGILTSARPPLDLPSSEVTWLLFADLEYILSLL